MTKCVTKSDLICWIERSLKNEDFSDCEITLLGTNEKGEGFIGDIVFANVIGNTKNNGKKELGLVIKHGKPNEHLRQMFPIAVTFETEIHFYTKLIPAFEKLQAEHKVRQSFDSIPKCYHAMYLDNLEVIVLNDLKKLGYQLHDKKIPLNLNHQKLVLQEYGKFHALSFALKDQKPKEFSALSIRPCAQKEFFKIEKLRNTFLKAFDDGIKVLEERNDVSLLAKLKKVVYKDACDIIGNLLYEDIPQSVFTHGDCWNNNFMYKYENNDRISPSKVKILDWQLSTMRSPVFDLSHFIYTTSSEEQLKKFDELIKAYYTSFSDFLRELGSDPEKLFSYSDLKDHWKKYSLYGVLYAPFALKFVLCDTEDAPELENYKDENNAEEYMEIKVKDEDLYYDRWKAILTHHLEFEF